MKVAAFDTATNTGVAIGSAGETPRAFSVNLAAGPGKVPWERRFSRLMRLTRRVIAEHKPDLVVVEHAVTGERKVGKGQKVMKPNADLIVLAGIVRGMADLMGVDCKQYWPGEVRAHFLGRGKKTGAPIKSQVFAKCQMLGWDVPDLDAADACALWSYAMALESRDHQMSDVGGLFRAS